MEVSVIIPTFNRLSLLKEAIASVLQQTIGPVELIIVDDGSNDGTWEWLQTLQTKKIKAIHKKQEGPGVARNFGVSQSTGNWIAFLDSDDFWKPGKLEVQMDFLKNNPQYKICQTEEVWIRNGVRVNPKRRHLKHSGYIFSQCLKLCIISPSAVVIDKKFFEDLGGFDPEFPVCEDYDLWLRATLKSPVMTLDQALTVKRGGHMDQLSRKLWGMDRFRVRSMEKLLARGELIPEQRQLLLNELENKLLILAKGFAKHRAGEENPYEERLSWLQGRYHNVRMGEGLMN